MVQSTENRQREGRGFPGAALCLRNQMFWRLSQKQRQRVFLDLGRLCELCVVNAFQQILVPKFSKISSLGDEVYTSSAEKKKPWSLQ